MGSYHKPPNFLTAVLPETSCAYLLQELKLIWDEVGQEQLERERIFLEMEQECMEVYKRKVDAANISRVRLHQALAESEAELTNLLISLGERSLPGRPEKLTGSLKEQLDSITPVLRELKLRKEERVNQFSDVQRQIQRISREIAGESEHESVVVSESDLSLKKLEEYQNELYQLNREKSDRLLRMEEYIKVVRDLAAIMGMEYSKIITDVHPSLDGSNKEQTKNISDNILDRLESTVHQLKDEKKQRMEKLCRLGKALNNLWNLMNTPTSERQSFTHITTNVSSGISKLGSLTFDLIHQVESEVERLDQLKATKMKELFFNKLTELEGICKNSHMEILPKSEMDNIMNLIMSGVMDHAELLLSMEEHISNAREEACSRKDIMEKAEKWMESCNEESWLEEYSRDENRYSVNRGAHKNLMRAERARITVNKIPVLVKLLMEKTTRWEVERKKIFLYDEVPLSAMLEEYTLLRQEKEEEKYRERERKKIQGQIVAEQAILFGIRPSTSTQRLPNRSLNCSFSNASPINRRLSNNSPTQRTYFNKQGKKT